MKQVLKVKSVNDYASYVGAEVLHPHVSIVHYDELQHCRHSLNQYGVYGLFLIEESPYTISYGQGQYSFTSGTMMCVAPGQMGGVPDDGEEIHIKGWVLLFAPQLLVGSDLERRIKKDYHFFSYYENEALHMQPSEWRVVETCLKLMRHELRTNRDAPRQTDILLSYIQLLLEYCLRFYRRQFRQQTSEGKDSDLLKRFDALLHDYYGEERQLRLGLPTVKYCAGELCLSPNYFGDLIRQATGTSAISIIQSFVMRRAASLLTAGHTVTETSELLGFEYPQHFTRLFKNHFGMPPSRYAKNTER